VFLSVYSRAFSSVVVVVVVVVVVGVVVSAELSKGGARLRSLWWAPNSYCAEQIKENRFGILS
jgi:hypothetical protein